MRCKVCGDPVPSHNKYHCSKACATASAWTERNCTHCGKAFKARTSYTKRGQMKFCSHECSAIAGRKNEVKTYRGKNFYLTVQGYYHSPKDNIKMHRYVWECERGPIPEGYIVHHIDHDKTNNAIENLEIMTHGEHSSHHNQGKDRSKPKRPCIVGGCGRHSKARGKCTKHYQQEMAKGVEIEYEDTEWVAHEAKGVGNDGRMK